MAKLNSYMGLAENDYLYAKNSLSVGKEIGNFNGVAALCSQSAEKYLKAVIEKCFIDDEDAAQLLHSHNLRALYNKISTKYPLEFTSRECKWLGDFYFDARYPGDNFVTVNEDDAMECLRLVEIIGQDVRTVLNDEEEKRAWQKEQLQNLKAF